MEPLTGNNPINNPRLDLLHNTGDNQQLAGAAGSYGPGYPSSAAPHPGPQLTKTGDKTGSSPDPKPAAPTGIRPPKEASSYVSEAESTRPKTPVPLPPSPPAPPEPRHVTPPPAPEGEPRRKRWPLVAGVLVMVMAVGGAGWWLLLGRNANSPQATPTVQEVQPLAPSSLVQTDGSQTIDQGKATNATKLTFEFTVATSANHGSLTPQIELRSNNTAFTGQPTATGDPQSANGSDMKFSVTVNNITSGAYHWQARVVKDGQNGNWTDFGGDASVVAFTVDTQAPEAPIVTTVGGVAPAGGSVTVTTNRPVISGTADANTTIAVSLSPGNISLKATADGQGNWSVTPDSDIATGQYQLSVTSTDAANNQSPALTVALSVSQATASSATQPTSSTATSSSTASTSTSSTQATKLAPTGDDTHTISLISLLLMAVAAGGWLTTRWLLRERS